MGHFFITCWRVGLPMDSFGLIPEALDEACRQGDARFVYCTPTVHNPTAAVIPLDRRKAIADIIARYSLTLIENDIYGLMHDAPILPISALLPDNAHYITGASKCNGAGIRLGYVIAPTMRSVKSGPRRPRPVVIQNRTNILANSRLPSSRPITFDNAELTTK